MANPSDIDGVVSGVGTSLQEGAQGSEEFALRPAANPSSKRNGEA